MFFQARQRYKNRSSALFFHIFSRKREKIWPPEASRRHLAHLIRPAANLHHAGDAAQTRAEGTVGISVRIGDILAIAFALAGPLLKWFLRFKRAHAHDAPAAHQGVEAETAQKADKTEEQTEKLTA